MVFYSALYSAVDIQQSRSEEDVVSGNGSAGCISNKGRSCTGRLICFICCNLRCICSLRISPHMIDICGNYKISTSLDFNGFGLDG